MKRFILLALIAAFVLGGAAFAGATELKVSGEFQVNADFSDNVPGFMSNKHFNDAQANAGNLPTGARAGDPYSIHQRMRNYFTFVSSENLKAVWGVEIGTGYWGKRGGNTATVASGATIGTSNGTVSGVGQGSGFGLDGDGVNVETKWAYLDFNIPNTVLNVKAGLLPAVLPNAFGPSSMIIDADLPALVVTAPVHDMFAVVAGYTRLTDFNQTGESNRIMDDSDAVFLAVPVTPMKGLTFTPYGMYALVGRDAYEPTFTSAMESGIVTPATGTVTAMYPSSGNTMGLLAPLNLTNVVVTNGVVTGVGGAKEETTAWWGGLAFDMKLFDPFVFDADFIYGKEENTGLKIDRSGWMADARIQYKGLGTLGTPNLFFMYSSGEDDNSFNVAGAQSLGNGKSERMPFVWERWQIPGSMWYGGSAFDVTGSSGGKLSDFQGMSNPIGTWVVGAGMYGMSFVEGLTHDLLVLYAQGTNNKNSVAQLRQEGFGIGTALTTKDHLIEVDFNHQYQIYEQLQAILELGMIIPDYDKNVGWAGAINAANGTITNASFTTDNAWRVLFGLKYKY